MSGNFKVGDPVWARMKSYQSWPGVVLIPPVQDPNPPKKSQWIFFFGSNNYGWVENNSIKPYLEYKDEYSKGSKAGPFKSGLKEIEKYIEKKKEDSEFEWDFPPQKDLEPENQPKKVSASKTRKSSTKFPPKKGLKRDADDRDASESPIIVHYKKKTKGSSKRPEENGSHTIEDEREEFMSLDTVPLCSKSPTVDLNNISEVMKQKQIAASTKVFGFMGVGPMGSGMVKNLINSGHRVNLFNRRTDLANSIKAQADANRTGFVEIYSTACDMVRNSDIIFCCVTDRQAVKEIIFGDWGVLAEPESMENKGYVEMSSIDAETSKEHAAAIEKAGGKYLEAQLHGSVQESDEGSLMIISSGWKPLFEECQSCFKAMGRTAFYIGATGRACTLNLSLNIVCATTLVGLSESAVMAERFGFQLKAFDNVLKRTDVHCQFVESKLDRIAAKKFVDPEHPIQNVQKDIRMCLEASNTLKQSLHMTAMANEVFKQSRSFGYDGSDSSCVYLKTTN